MKSAKSGLPLAIDKAKSNDHPPQLSPALENLGLGDDRGEICIRAGNHQLGGRLYISALAPVAARDA
ncbi:MAG TPA: hypothetical protein VN496_07360 [Burkholderiales bacterium]|nr:hypothetical protein [Burkholderiales bacterium]